MSVGKAEKINNKKPRLVPCCFCSRWGDSLRRDMTKPKLLGMNCHESLGRKGEGAENVQAIIVTASAMFDRMTRVTNTR